MAREESRLPVPVCEYGYTMAQLAEPLGRHEPAFREWMMMKAHAICDGRPPCTRPHADVYYRHDVLRFFEHVVWRTALPAEFLLEQVYDAHSDGMVDPRKMADRTKRDPR